MRDDLHFNQPNNSALSLRIIAERVRAEQAEVIVAVDRGEDVLEIKIKLPGFRLKT